MRIKLILAAVALVMAGAGTVNAQTTPAESRGGPSVPTVTIINKSPEAPAGTAAPELAVSPPEASPSAETAGAPAQAAGASSAALPEASSAGVAATSETGADAAASSAEAVSAPPPEPTLAISIDLTRQRMTVSEQGRVLHTWPVSTARYGYRTPTGRYQPTWMAKMWYSRQYDNAPMPHAIFFHKGVAIHATTATRMLGRPASHGCVRLAPKNAATLFKMVNAHGKARTSIVVHGKPPHSGAQVAARDGGRREVRQRYLPPSSARHVAPAGGYYAPRTRRYAAPPRPPRGLFSSGYGF